MLDELSLVRSAPDAPAAQRRTSWRVGAAALLLAVTANASLADTAVPSGTAMDVVRSRLGIPQAIRFDGTGTQSWEYLGRRAPSGAYRLTFDATGSVREALALRTPERFAQVRAGVTTAEQLVMLLGEPAKITMSEAGAAWRFDRHGARPVTVTLGADRRVISMTGFD